MNPEDLKRKTERAREAAEETSRHVDQELRDLGAAAGRLGNLRKAEREALKLLIITELFASFSDDPDATASWLHECVEEGRVAERVREDW